MKITYEFDTQSENYDRTEQARVEQSFNMMIALSRIQDRLRDWLKWDSYPVINEYTEYWNDLNEDQRKYCTEHKVADIDKIADEIYNIIDEAGVRLDEMIY